MKENEMGRSCSTHGIDEKYMQNFGRKGGNRPLRRPRKDGRMILELMSGKYGGSLWTGCIWFRRGTDGLVAFQKGLSSMHLRSQSINQSVNHSVNQSFCQLVIKSVNQSVRYKGLSTLA